MPWRRCSWPARSRVASPMTPPTSSSTSTGRDRRAEQERQAAVEGAGWHRVYAEEDDHEWADGLMVDGVKIDVSGFVTTTIDDYLDRASRGDTEAELQVRITALLDGVIVHGEPVIDAWRSRCRPYPEALARAMVEHGLDLRSQERLEMLAARDDVVLLHRDLVDGVQGVLDALFGANRVYAPHPFHKWLECGGHAARAATRPTSSRASAHSSWRLPTRRSRRSSGSWRRPTSCSAPRPRSGRRASARGVRAAPGALRGPTPRS